jgi:hypothetical protein
MKDKFKIGFFCADSHAGMMIELFQDALEKHTMVESVDWETTFSKFGKHVLVAVGKQFLINNINKYDLIFIQLEIVPSVRKLFDDLDLWSKIIIYDIKDDQKFIDPITYQLSTEYVDKPLLYIKRSWDEYHVPKGRKNIIPLDFGIMSAYLDVLPNNYFARRDLPITSTLMQGNNENIPRNVITNLIRKADWPNINDEVIQVTLFYSTGFQVGLGHTLYRHELNPPPPYINLWYIYMHILSRTKILFTAAAHNATGDTRTWEAFSRGPLVFIDNIPIPQPNPLVAGEHYIKIDIRNPEKIITQAKELLKDETERAKIAKAGHEHAVKYHSSQARVNYVMDEIVKRLKEKENV